MNHKEMMGLTAAMPMKTIEINGEPYLERYFSHSLDDGTQVWYHRFLRNDSERHLHSHPWKARSKIMCGKYVEAKLIDGNVERCSYLQGQSNILDFETIHRIIEVEPDTWTEMIVEPERLETWYFLAEDGSKTVMETSPIEWHKGCQARATL